MNPKNDLQLSAKSAESLAYAQKDTPDVIADHEARIKRTEQKLGFLADVKLHVAGKAVSGGCCE